MHRYISAGVKHVLGGLAATAVLACAVPATALAQSTIQVDKQAAALVPENIRQKGVITVAMDATYAPFEYIAPNGKIIGFDADASDALAAVLGLKAKQVNVRFTSIIPALQAHKYDMAMSAFSITPKREKVVDFVGPYAMEGSSLEVPANNPLKMKMDALTMCGRKIGAVGGSTQASSALPALSKQCVDAGKDAISIKAFTTQTEANLAMVSGRIDGVLADSGTAGYQSRLSKGRFVLAPGPVYDPAPYGIALPKDSALEPAIKAALQVLKDNGTLKQLAAKWLDG